MTTSNVDPDAPGGSGGSGAPQDHGMPHDPRVEAAWRAASPEEPPAALDAAILAAARREVGAGPQSLSAQAVARARRRWWPLAAAATIAAVAIGIVQRVTHEDLGAPTGNTAVSDMPAQVAKPAPEPARSTAATTTAMPEPARSNAETAKPAAASARPRADTTRPAAAPAPPPAATTTPAPREQSAASGGAAGEAQHRSDATAPKLEAGSAPPAAASPAAPMVQHAIAPAAAPMAKTADAQAASQHGEAEGRVKNLTPLPVPDWIALIRRLRAQGNTADAARELAAFRAAHTDHEKLLPPDLRDWRPVEN